jgi:hypothetical protein
MMHADPPSPTTLDRAAALRIAIEGLPQRCTWYGTLRMRGDGSSPDGVFEVIDAIRMEYQVRLGDLGDLSPDRAIGITDKDVNATQQDRKSAYLLAIDSLPSPGLWHAAVKLRQDGSTPGGVFASLKQLRMDLQVKIGDLQDRKQHVPAPSAPAV